MFGRTCQDWSPPQPADSLQMWAFHQTTDWNQRLEQRRFLETDQMQGIRQNLGSHQRQLTLKDRTKCEMVYVQYTRQPNIKCVGHNKRAIRRAPKTNVQAKINNLVLTLSFNINTFLRCNKTSTKNHCTDQDNQLTVNAIFQHKHILKMQFKNMLLFTLKMR